MRALVSAFLVLVLGACGGEKTPLEQGRVHYLRACSRCHGPQGDGVGNIGNRIRDNEFVRAKTDDELVAFLRAGRAPSDPDNKSGMPMPPLGGDRRLAEEDLRTIVLFLRTLSP